MAEQLRIKADDQTLSRVKAALNGDLMDIPKADPHEHINLVPELELEI